MGAEPWRYFVPYSPDIEAALQALRQREFDAGRYYKRELVGGPEPPATIDELTERIGESGTRSILDVFAVTDTPMPGAVAMLQSDDVTDLFGTDRPSRDLAEQSGEIFGLLGRGEAACFVVYDDGEPAEICFAGYSCD